MTSIFDDEDIKVELAAAVSEINILCVSWNAGGIRMCETTNTEEKETNRKGLKSIAKSKGCVIPDWFDILEDHIASKKPKIVIISTQDESSDKTYFHSDFLPAKMKNVVNHKTGETANYIKFSKHYKLANVGQLSSGVSVQFDKEEGGEVTESALRMSIYFLESTSKQIVTPLPNPEYVSFSQGDLKAGAIVANFKHTVYGNFSVTAADTPIEANIFPAYKDMPPDILSNARYLYESLCQTQIMYVANEKSSAKGYKPDYIILLGTFNYEINLGKLSDSAKLAFSKIITSQPSEDMLRAIQVGDYCTRAKMAYPLAGFQEGPQNSGPIFIPTWRLTRNRSNVNCSTPSLVNGSYLSLEESTLKNLDNKYINQKELASDCFDNKTGASTRIGWFDRVLYKNSRYDKKLICREYSRFDVGNMNKSDHAAVFAEFTIADKIRHEKLFHLDDWPIVDPFFSNNTISNETKGLLDVIKTDNSMFASNPNTKLLEASLKEIQGARFSNFL